MTLFSGIFHALHRVRQHAVIQRVFVLLGAFFISVGTNWYGTPHRPRGQFIGTTIVVWLGVIVAYILGCAVYDYVVKRRHIPVFWRSEGRKYLVEFFFFCSLFFLALCSPNDIVSLVYSGVVLTIVIAMGRYYLIAHPQAAAWRAVVGAEGVLWLSVFSGLGFLQYLSHHYYILDTVNEYIHVSILFRTIFVTACWFLLWNLVGCIPSDRPIYRRLAIWLWGGCFAFTLFLSVVNVGTAFFSGLYFNPIVFEHASGAVPVIFNRVSGLLFILWLTMVGVTVWILTKQVRTFRQHVHVARAFHAALLLPLAVILVIFYGSGKFTPEYITAESFYQFYHLSNDPISLTPLVQEKLQRFGLFYSPNKFLVNERAHIFAPTSTVLLPKQFSTSSPNVLIVYFESLSARLTDVYNSHWVSPITPGLTAFVTDPHTTVFRKYYNASTPTITGILSSLCSFLPPTGHQEIAHEKRFQRLYLACLPRVLKEQAGYKKTVYITAVDKDYANKDTLFRSMGVDEVYGTTELSQLISGKPLAWGYSDHQMFPALFDLMMKAPRPSLFMLSTVDNHVPFTIAKDMISYRDGKLPVLNSVHTTDDAFQKFWEVFKASSLYENTIVVAMADHAIFPAVYRDQILPPGATTTATDDSRLYDENVLAIYVPHSILPRQVDRYASGIDLAPTILHILHTDATTSFEGHSIFDDRIKYPNLLGMHEFGLYINEVDAHGDRHELYALPHRIDCQGISPSVTSSEPLTLCEYQQFFQWKRQMLMQGRFWVK